MYSEEDGELAIRLARAVIDQVVKGKALPEFDLPDIFKKKSGAFVTINVFPELRLRGCIGYPEPYFPLFESLVRGAEGATQDPRFPRLAEKELDNIVVEVSLLTPPELIEVKRPKDYLGAIKVGRDGLIVQKSAYKGLLLPQVPVEWGWNVEKFLNQTCMKAGLLPDTWKRPETKVYKFMGEIFRETEPRGKVVRKVLDG